jgi:hypothetical protein
MREPRSQPTPRRAERTAARRQLVRRRLRIGIAAGLVAAAVVVLWVGRPPPAPRRALLVAVGPTLADSARISGDPGPARWREGVPVGWAPTRQGAVAAAAAYGRLLSSRWFLTDAARRERALAVMAAPGSLGVLETAQRQLAGALASGPFGMGLGQPSVTSVLTLAYLGWRLDGFQERELARVALWAVVVAGNNASVPPEAVWTTSTLVLRRIADDWKLQDAQTIPGPVPVGGQVQPSTPIDLVAAMRDFEAFADVPLG